MHAARWLGIILKKAKSLISFPQKNKRSREVSGELLVLAGTGVLVHNWNY